jgi:glycosyltransferase involved in cell wall biosynthesis
VVKDDVPSEPIRVVHVASGLRTGGAEMSLLRLVQHLDSPSFPSLVVALRAGGAVAEKMRELGIQLIEIEGNSISQSLRNWRQAVERVEQFRPSVIHGWMYDGNLAASWMHRRMRNDAKLAWNVRSSIATLGDRPFRLKCSILLNALYSARPDVVVFNSLAAVGQHRRIGFRAKKVAVIANGLDVSNFPPMQPEFRAEARRQLGFAAETLVVCIVARFHPMKDHANFLAAASRLRDTNASFLMIGPGVVETEPRLASLIRRFKLEGRVTCIGERHDIPELLAAADVFCLSSAWGEGWPNSVAEGMASGLPCVVTDVGDSAILLGDGGIVVPPGDSAALAEALREILSLPPAVRTQVGQRGRLRILNEFTVDQMARNYAEMYRAAATGMSHK